jgi:hypothetical protein
MHERTFKPMKERKISCNWFALARALLYDAALLLG